MKISIIVDNKDSWFNYHLPLLCSKIKELGHKVCYLCDAKEIKQGDIALFLSCGKIVSKETLSLNKHNLVVHESALPKGKGWSPLTWQILEGKNTIPITLFEANESVDSGNIYSQVFMRFEGHELVEELRRIQAEKTIELVLKFVNTYPNVFGIRQEGKESFYTKRTPKDSEINPNKTIIELFNHFRVADNERYPVFFCYKGHKYILKIYKG